MPWHPNLHVRRVHPNSTCRPVSITLPLPHLTLANELCSQLRINRSELLRRLLEAVAADDLPVAALEASRSQYRRRQLMRPYEPLPSPDPLQSGQSSEDDDSRTGQPHAQ